MRFLTTTMSKRFTTAETCDQYDAEQELRMEATRNIHRYGYHDRADNHVTYMFELFRRAREGPAFRGHAMTPPHYAHEAAHTRRHTWY